MMLLSTQPGISLEKILDNTEFELLLVNSISENIPPVDEELLIIREEVDGEMLSI